MVGCDVPVEDAVLALPLQGPQVLGPPEVPASATLPDVVLATQLAGDGVADV